MKVKKISAANVEACSLPKLFDEEKIDFQSIQCVNWAEYPYKPKVNFRIAHTQNSILLHFKVKEESVRAKYGKEALSEISRRGSKRTFAPNISRAGFPGHIVVPSRSMP